MNRLAEETSPYLLQHKDNPVHWMAWGEEAWKKAKAENKPVLVSIGYSACHWCHVMEHEVFEDFECAELMNLHFVCIKVDREERPDIDSIYMDAVHLMGSKGGWPLNVFALPDGRPIYGGTYFPKSQWINVLENIHDLFKNEYEKVAEYASRLHSGITQLSIIADQKDEHALDPEFLDKVMEHWSQFWDLEKGGARRAPKFPMPNNVNLLLHYGVLRNDKHALAHALNTLEKMALGGIYDQCGGGFSRYSVDDTWKVPHFEKMLYDNAQLISSYAHAYRITGLPLFYEVIQNTVEWLQREMLAPEGVFYSALDADSEGEEGKYYTWTESEINTLFGENADFVKRYYAVGKEGFWEHGNNILLRTRNDEVFAGQNGMSLAELKLLVAEINKKLLDNRNNRIKPGLDDKCITSWNAMLITGLCHAYRATLDEGYRNLAITTFRNLCSANRRNDGSLWHQITKGKQAIDGFIDDYAFLAEAALELYEITFDQLYITWARELVNHAVNLFQHPVNALFYFSTEKNEWLTRRQEVQDNVIPSANSVMAAVLHRLSRYTGETWMEENAARMLRNVLPQIEVASGYSNWLQLYARLSMTFFEVVITGKDSATEVEAMMKSYLPQVLLAASTTESELPLLQGRIKSNTSIYVCAGRTCFPPVSNAAEAMQYIHENKLDD